MGSFFKHNKQMFHAKIQYEMKILGQQKNWINSYSCFEKLNIKMSANDNVSRKPGAETRNIFMSVRNAILHNKNSQKMDRNSTKHTHTHTIYTIH